MPPIADGGAPDSAWIGELVSDVLPQSLRAGRRRRVARADRLRARGGARHPARSRSPAPRPCAWPRPWRRRASWRGTYRVENGGVTLSLRVLDLERGTLSTPFVINGPQDSLGDLVHVLAWDIALATGPPPPLTREVYLAQKPLVPPAALEAYGRALAAATRRPRGSCSSRRWGCRRASTRRGSTLGRLQLAAREFEQAEDTLARVPPDAPQARAARFDQAIARLRLGRYREAAELFGELSAAAPTPAALNNQAIALLRFPGRGPDPKPSDVVRRALEAEPGSVDLAFNLGWALLWEGDLAGAEQQLRSVLQQDPLDGHARAVLVWTLRKGGREAEAQEEWKAVLALAPSYESLEEPGSDASLRARARRRAGTRRRPGQPHRCRGGGGTAGPRRAALAGGRPRGGRARAVPRGVPRPLRAAHPRAPGARPSRGRRPREGGGRAADGALAARRRRRCAPSSRRSSSRWGRTTRRGRRRRRS